jgi:DNA-binding MarR family transcriptional regulator
LDIQDWKNEKMHEADEYDLRSTDWNVLDAFDSRSDFGFQGLKRKLGIHQETLSRALHRLEDDQLIEHTTDGYRLTPQGSAIAKRSNSSSRTQEILETYLPSDISVSQLINRLKYSWFSTLRWLGYAENKDETALNWVTEDGISKIIARFKGKRLTIEIEPHDYALSDSAIKFAHELLARITKEYTHMTTNPTRQLASTPNSETKYNMS